MKYILLVEDSPDQAMLIKRWLAHWDDVSVVWASSGEEACHALAAQPFDLMLADIYLPDMNGTHIVRHAKGVQPRCCIAFVTAQGSVSNAQTAIRMGVDDFLVKPLQREPFQEKIRELLARHEETESSQRVLAIGAHPDDVEIGCGGTLLRHVALGHEVTLMTLSGGENGGVQSRRAEEAATAARWLGAELILKNLPDTGVPSAGATIELITEAVERLQPSVVYTHSLHDNHQDHRAVHQATRVAARRVPSVLCYQSPSSTVSFCPVFFSDVDAFLERKLHLISCYASQTARCDYLKAEVVRATACYWGRYAGYRQVEPFEVVRAAELMSFPGDALEELRPDEWFESVAMGGSSISR